MISASNIPMFSRKFRENYSNPAALDQFQHWVSACIDIDGNLDWIIGGRGAAETVANKQILNSELKPNPPLDMDTL